MSLSNSGPSMFTFLSRLWKTKGRNANHARPEVLVYLRRDAIGAPIAGRSLVSVSSNGKLPVFGSNAEEATLF
jgi:hypothetical protein